MFLPRARQSIHPMVYGQSDAASSRCVLELVDVVDPPTLLPDPLRRDSAQSELDFEDVARQTHPADGGSKEIGVLLGRAFEHAAVGDPHLERGDMVTEVSVA